MGLAFLFPGQNSHFVGMGKDLYEAGPAARELLDQANAALGLALTELMFEGPEDELTATQNQQPAVVAHSAACLALLEARGVRPDMVAGHSLGEYSAVVAAGVLPFADAVSLVRKRGELMAAAGGGAMAAVLGLDLPEVEAACEAAREVGTVIVANHNCPGQLVISGELQAVEAASRLLSDAGAKRVLALRVTGAFHSPLMRPAAEELRLVLGACSFRDAAVPLVSNVDATARTEASAIRDALSRQIVSPVLWETSIRAMVGGGISTFVEVGPGKALSGMIRRVSRDVTVHQAGTVEAVAALDLG